MIRPVQRDKLGRYELLTELGRGGMAELFLGRLVGVAGFSKLVAIKRMLPHISHDKHFVEMFLNEGRIAAQLSHPNVCQVYELGEDHGQLFLAMEYLEGVSWETLAPLLPDDPHEAVRIIAGVLGQACDGLHYAHELRTLTGEHTPVIHRDVSPQNLFVTVDGVCKVLDFGVSKMMNEGTRTRSGVIKGKLPYMSPEQIAGEQVDARSDTFAAGIVLWEALTGKHLFHRSTDYLIWNAVLTEEAPPVTEFGPEIAELVGRALARDPAQRYPSAAALAADLRRVASVHGGAASAAELASLVRTQCAELLATRARGVASAIGARAREPSAADTFEDAGATASMALRAESVPIAEPRRRWLGVVLVASALVVVGAVAFAVARGSHANVTSRDAAVASVRADGAVVASAPADAAIPDAAAARVESVTHAPKLHGRPVTHATRAVSIDAGVVEPPKAGGTLTVDSRPFARIYIDGQQRAGKQGETPAFHIPLAAGSHRIRLVLEDGRDRTIDVRVEPGADVNLGTLTWPASSRSQ